MELGIFERQLRLMVLLTQNREYSLDELCRKLDMSRRTLYRYLELFRDIGFEVVKQGNVYRLDKSSPFFKEITQLVHFTEDEALTLRHVLDMASGTDVQVRHLRHKLERIYDFGILNAVEADPGQAEKLQQLYEAVKLHRQVVLHDYSSAHSNRTSVSGPSRRNSLLRTAKRREQDVQGEPYRQGGSFGFVVEPRRTACEGVHRPVPFQRRGTPPGRVAARPFGVQPVEGRMPAGRPLVAARRGGSLVVVDGCV